ncbi:MAG TPA: indolepyruvate oxidoreductase subunit beta family protein [Steroidobacteraceae bacterium]
MSATAFKLAIAALGGQGGAVLTGWLVEIAEANAYLVQTTSVPGVAQRTGATLYYLEFFARAALGADGREPVMALMPVAGDVDCVVAAELVEAGRSMVRGLVTPERTTLIASSHREFTIGERSAMGRTASTAAELIEIATHQAHRFILFDMAAMAAKHESVISAVLLGAIAGCAVLPFPKEAFESAIRRSGLAVTTNLAAFEDAYTTAAAGTVAPPVASAPPPLGGEIPRETARPALQDLLARLKVLPAAVQPLALAGVRRLIDYQDPAYAKLYLERIARVAQLEAAQASPEHALAENTARHLALWMSFEDTIRVADIKTRASRGGDVRSEVRAAPGQLIDVTEFMKPRVEEIIGTLPARLGRRLGRSARAARFLARFTGGKRVRSSTISGFLLLRALARLKRWRRGTLRYQTENARIEGWLAQIEQLSSVNPALAVEVARAQRLIKGYGDTHERGWRNFSALMNQLGQLQNMPDGAATLARLLQAALADEEGVAFARELAMLTVAPASITATG